MERKRDEPFLLALGTLRERLREGAFGFERRLAATEIAGQLALSPTPVREALARLAGEGLVEERRGQGYFVRRPSAMDIADLYRLSLAHLVVALDARRLPLGPGGHAAGEAAAAAEPVAEVERLFADWVREAGGWALGDAYGRVRARLAPLRRHEAPLIPDLAQEAQALAALAVRARAERLAAVRRFHRRRIELAGRLAGLLEMRPPATP